MIGVTILAALLAAPTVPQQPFAAGPLRSIAQVIDAARACDVTHIRLDLGKSQGLLDSPEATRLYFVEMPQKDPRHCLDSWLTQNGKRLHLEPRWWNDDFTRDRPEGMD